MARGLVTQYPSDADSPGLLLWQVSNAWQAAQRAALRPFGLTHVQFVLLASLAWRSGDGATRQRDLAEHARADAMMTSQVLRTLEAQGLVERCDHPSDRRARAVAVTAAGLELVNRANSAVEQVDADYFAVLGDEQGAFTGMLASLADQGRRRAT